jgi:hypothetical protein
MRRNGILLALLAVVSLLDELSTENTPDGRRIFIFPRKTRKCLNIIPKLFNWTQINADKRR